MTRTSAEWLLLGALLVVAWMVVAQGVRAPAAPPGAARDPVPAIDDPVGDGLEARARHLRAYLAAPPARGAARRNLFSFPAPRRAAVPETVERAGDPGDSAAEAAPVLTLSGIAEDEGAAGPVRTAVISAAGQLVFAKEGDRVLSRFLVLRIAADAVQVKDTVRDEVFTLAFK